MKFEYKSKSKSKAHTGRILISMTPKEGKEILECLSEYRSLKCFVESKRILGSRKVNRRKINKASWSLFNGISSYFEEDQEMGYEHT